MNPESIYQLAVKKANDAKNDLQFNEAVEELIGIANVHAQAAFEVYAIFKRVEDMKTACVFLRLAAEQGHERANLILAQYLVEGRFIQKDEQEALNIILKYTDNIPFAANLAGYILLTAEQIQRNTQKAVNFFVKASGMGFAQASYNIGLICNGETGNQRNVKSALNWFATAVSQGNSDACYKIAEIYTELGKYNEAYKYLCKGTEMGNKACANICCKFRDLYISKPAPIKTGITQSHMNQSEYSYTGQAEEERRAEQERIERINRRRDAMVAATAVAGGGFINYETGVATDMEGNVILVDENGFITSSSGTSFYDKELRMLFDSKRTTVFDDNMQYMYDLNGGSVKPIFKI